MEIWQSSDKNKLGHFYWHTLYTYIHYEIILKIQQTSMCNLTTAIKLDTSEEEELELVVNVE